MFNLVLILLVMLTVFFIYVATRNGHFRYERSGVIKASPEKIFPYISQLHLGEKWSPYEQKDPSMKKTILGDDGKPGASMEFEGNRDAGSGKIKILKIVPNQKVEMQLLMTKPFEADHLVEYILIPESEGTRFSWVMSGNGGFFGKLLNVLIDCEEMVTKDFVKGIANLKAVVEAK